MAVRRRSKPKGRKKDPRIKRAGVKGFNKPKRTPGHKTKSHIVVAKVGSRIKTIRFGQKGAKTAGKPKAGESRRMKMKRKSFKARHAKNISNLRDKLNKLSIFHIFMLLGGYFLENK